MTENIPAEMKAEKRWCVWRYQDRGGKPTKVPFQVSGQAAKSNNSNTWVDFESALSAVGDRYDGVGFFLGDGWTGVDLDNCMDSAGDLLPWARDIIEKIDSYWETSPSGNGAKCFAKGPLPEGNNKRKIGEDGGIEMYGHGRYFTVTGEHLPESPREVRPQTQGINQVHQEYVVNDVSAFSGDVMQECKEHLLHALPDSIEGNFGHNALLRAACEIRRWGFDTDDALELLHYYNDHKCTPPWENQELERKWSEACTKFEPDMTVAVTGPRNPKIELPFELGLISDVQLEEEEVNFEWLVEDVIVAGQHGVIGGVDKSMKTSIIVDLAISLATGTDFLGRFKVPEAVPVCVISGESGRPALRHLARRVRTAREALPQADLHWGFTLPNLGTESHLEALRMAIAIHGIRFMVIDPAYLSMNLGDDAKNMFKMGPLLNAYSLIGSQMNCTMFLCHHLTKQVKKNNTPALRDLSMSGFSSWTRQWLLLNPASDFRAESGGLDLKMIVGGSAGFGGKYTLTIDQGKKAEGFPGYAEWNAEVSGGDSEERFETEEPEPEPDAKPDEVEARAEELLEASKKREEWTMRELTGNQNWNKRAVGEINVAAADLLVEKDSWRVAGTRRQAAVYRHFWD